MLNLTYTEQEVGYIHHYIVALIILNYYGTTPALPTYKLAKKVVGLMNKNVHL